MKKHFFFWSSLFSSSLVFVAVVLLSSFPSKSECYFHTFKLDSQSRSRSHFDLITYFYGMFIPTEHQSIQTLTPNTSIAGLVWSGQSSFLSLFDAHCWPVCAIALYSSLHISYGRMI